MKKNGVFLRLGRDGWAEKNQKSEYALKKLRGTWRETTTEAEKKLGSLESIDILNLPFVHKTLY